MGCGALDNSNSRPADALLMIEIAIGTELARSRGRTYASLVVADGTHHLRYAMPTHLMSPSRTRRRQQWQIHGESPILCGQGPVLFSSARRNPTARTDKHA